MVLSLGDLQPRAQTASRITIYLSRIGDFEILGTIVFFSVDRITEFCRVNLREGKILSGRILSGCSKKSVKNLSGSKILSGKLVRGKNSVG